MVNITTAPHYVWGNGCDGWHLVRTPELSVIQERMPPDAAETRHYHTRARQFFYVLAGVLTIEVAGQVETLLAGDGCEVPPDAAHQVFNRSAEDVTFLVISQPLAQGDRVAA